jgi:serine/threonine protein kinase
MRIGPYEVTAPLGAGGMGEVYRAHDTKLHRDVAIKVLPAAFAQDPERMARFRREAHVLASLNHPHIAAIYGLEEFDGTLALAIELVEGEDLAERLAKRGAIPVDEAIEIARQIAQGLEAAHEKGIVHRDLKPANVKIASDGTVKILDFGLAKAYEGGAVASDTSVAMEHTPTMTRNVSEGGLLLGTAAYMAPEQARGTAIDRRVDIWAFGVVLYEVLTGRRLFAGNTVSDVLAAVLRQDVDLETLPADGYNNAGQSAAARVLHRATDATVNRPRSRCSREPRERQQRKRARPEVPEANCCRSSTALQCVTERSARSGLTMASAFTHSCCLDHRISQSIAKISCWRR